MGDIQRCFRLVWFSLALVAALGPMAQGLRAQGEDAVPLRNWPAPLAWQATTAAEVSIQRESGNREPQPLMTTTGGSALLATLVAITPCRLIDTRVGHDPGGFIGWPVGSTTSIAAFVNYNDTCGASLPVALAYSANITLRMSYGGGTLGFLTVWPAGTTMPSASALNNVAGLLTVNNAAVIPTGTGANAGKFDVFLSSNGTATKVDVIIDINGYYISPDSLQLGAGTAGVPALTFGSDATTGLYSTGIGNLAMAAGGANIANVNSTGFSVTGNLDFSGAITQSGESVLQSSLSQTSLAVGLFAHLSGLHNSAFGYNALGASNSGSDNVAVGVGAANNNSGNFNVAVGFDALALNTSGSNNTAVGLEALEGLGVGPSPGSVGNDSTAIGYAALLNNTASENTAVGSGALQKNTSGGRNTALGYNALDANTTASQNTAVGWIALGTATGSSNTAVGYWAGGDAASGMPWTGTANTFVGAGAGNSPVTGNFNTGIGESALANLTSGHTNVAIGPSAGLSLSTGSNNIYIGNLGAEESTTIRVGTQGTQTATYIAGIRDAGGSGNTVFVDANGKLFSLPSSRRFKQDIRDLGETDVLMGLRPVRFHYKADPNGPDQLGLIAEEVDEIAPELVGHDAKGQIDSVAYDKVYAMMLAELQKQRRLIEALERRLAEHESNH